MYVAPSQQARCSCWTQRTCTGPSASWCPLDEHWTGNGVNSLESLRAQTCCITNDPPPPLTSQQAGGAHSACTAHARRAPGIVPAIRQSRGICSAQRLLVRGNIGRPAPLKGPDHPTLRPWRASHHPKGYRFSPSRSRWGQQGARSRASDHRAIPQLQPPAPSLDPVGPWAGDVFAPRSSSSLPTAIFRFDDLRQPATRRHAA